VLTCGPDVGQPGPAVAGSNVNHPVAYGDAGPEAAYWLLVTEPGRVTVTTCGLGSAVDVSLALYATCGGTPLAPDASPDGACGSVAYDFAAPGHAWLVVDGRTGADEGAFSVQVTCGQLEPTSVPTPAPTGLPLPVPTAAPTLAPTTCHACAPGRFAAVQGNEYVCEACRPGYYCEGGCDGPEPCGAGTFGPAYSQVR
jgi:hypothetical protein